MSSPAGKIIDRSYLLHAQLGEGGMGAVYRATQMLTGQEVALKLIASEQNQSNVDDPDDRQRRLALAREFQTLASLHHPNIIRVLSYGFDDDFGPYFTMELLHSPTTLLHAGLEQPLEGKVLLIAQLLRALVYVHQRGILHRDIKPGNVLVVNGEVKLLDFGIAAKITHVSDLAGTLDYMAPELLLSQPPSIQSDLYSVGIMLFQLLTGTFPYSRRSLTVMLGDLLGEDSDFTFSKTVLSLLQGVTVSGDGEDEASSFAQKLAQLPADLPTALTDTLRKLLGRRPEERPATASAALNDLSPAISTPLPVETTATRESFLQSTELVGRETEIKQLTSAMEQAQLRQGAAFLIGGESGIGKSRLLAELRTQALVQGLWAAEGQAMSGASLNYQEFLPLFRGLCFRADASDAEASILKTFISDIDTLLGRPIPDPPVIKPEEIQGRLAKALVALFSKLTKPLLLILEDLHWAGSETLALLASLIKEITAFPVLLIATFRSDESPELHKQFPDAQHLPLRRLAATDISQLSESILGPLGKDPKLVGYLERQTEGNVFFLIEIVRALAENAGELQRIGQGELPENVLTLGIERIVERRIDRVQSAYRSALDLAAVYGRKLDLALMEKAFPNLALRSYLVECANAAILESQDNDWRFTHDKLRESILRRLDSQKKSHLHLQVAENLEVVHTEIARGPLSAKLAFHFTHGGLPERALPYHEMAGENALRMGLLGDARVHYRNGLDVLQQLIQIPTLCRQHIDLLLKLMHASLMSDSLEVQLKRVTEAQSLLDSLSNTGERVVADRLRQAQIDYYTGRARFYGGLHAQAIQLYRSVLPVAQEFMDANLTANSALSIGLAEFFRGYMGEANRLLTIAIADLKRLGNQYEVFRCQYFIGLTMVSMGRYQEGLHLIQETSAEVRRAELSQLVIVGQQSLCLAHSMAADWPRALEVIEPAVIRATQANDKIYMILCWSYQATALCYLGERETARNLRSKALELTHAMGGKVLFADRFGAIDGEMALLAGSPEAALRCAESILATSKPAGNVLSWGIAQRVRGVARSRLGLGALEADADMEESVRVFNSGDLLIEVPQTEVWWGQICRERGDEAAAQMHFARAIAQYEAFGCEYALAAARRIAA